MQTETDGNDSADARARDERWAAWVAQSAAYDKETTNRRILATAVIGGGLALWFVIEGLFR